MYDMWTDSWSTKNYGDIIGGPVTHLYESLTGNHWDKHGVSKYCCYSIYQQNGGEAAWTPLVVNRVLGEADEKEPSPSSTDETTSATTTFTWA